LQALEESGEAGLPVRIVRGRVHEHTRCAVGARVAARAPRAATQPRRRAA
jgi:hypothetical protein